MVRDLVCKAIDNKQRIQFVYHNKLRIGEPQCCGETTAGKDVVRVHMLSGGSRSEQLFDIDKIQSFIMLDEYFTKPGPNYRKNDSAMRIIYAQL